ESLAALDQHCRTDAGGTARDHEAGGSTASFEYIEQRRQQDSAARAHRVALCEMAPGTVHPFGIDVAIAQKLRDRHRERFHELDRINIAKLPPGLVEHAIHRAASGEQRRVGVAAAFGVSDDASARTARAAPGTDERERRAIANRRRMRERVAMIDRASECG